LTVGVDPERLKKVLVIRTADHNDWPRITTAKVDDQFLSVWVSTRNTSGNHYPSQSLQMTFKNPQAISLGRGGKDRELSGKSISE
jgi:hypothetical protein